MSFDALFITEGLLKNHKLDFNSLFYRTIRHSQFDLLSDEIVALFPSESKASYYIPALPKHLSRLNKSEIAKGKLVDKFRNKIKEYRRIAGVSKKKQRTANSAVLPGMFPFIVIVNKET